MMTGEMRRPASNAPRAEELSGVRVKYLGYWELRRLKRSKASRVARTTTVVRIDLGNHIHEKTY